MCIIEDVLNNNDIKYLNSVGINTKCNYSLENINKILYELNENCCGLCCKCNDLYCKKNFLRNTPSTYMKEKFKMTYYLIYGSYSDILEYIPLDYYMIKPSLLNFTILINNIAIESVRLNMILIFNNFYRLTLRQ